VILVDTSVWVEHLRFGVPALAALLDDGQVLMHPFVLGELACGNLKNRRVVLDLLVRLPAATTATDFEALRLIEGHALMGRGIGYIDVHLLAAARLGGTVGLWTRDSRLAEAAAALDVAFARD
jgi:hypothetical protein